jgi:hypothetical protein
MSLRARAQEMAAHESPRTTKPYNRRKGTALTECGEVDQAVTLVTLTKVERGD